MRHSLTLIGCLLATTAHADEFLVRADVTAATIFLNSITEVERQISLTVPAGAHEVLFAVPQGVWLEGPQVTGTGDARIGALNVEQGYSIDEGALDTDDVAAARAVIEGLEEEIEQMHEAIAEADSAVQAANLQRRYLEGVTATGDNAAPFPSDPELLGQMLTTLGAEMARIAEEARLAGLRRNELVEDLNDVITDLAAAQAALAELFPFGEQAMVLRVPVVAMNETALELTLTHFGESASWTPVYTLRLDSDAAEITIEREILIEQSGFEVWRDVALAVSTANPYRERAPQVVRSRPARIQDPAERRVTGGMISLTDGVAGAAYAPAPPLPVAIMEATVAVGQMIGASFTYSFPDAVSIAPSETSQQPMEALVFDVELINQANPRRDDTGFLIATLENDSGEPILPAEAIFYRDGELLGSDYVNLLSDGDSIDLAFGPLDHLQLEWRDLSLDEGESGVFTRSDTQGRSVEFSVENTSDETEEVRLLYAVPFAEQEDLDVDVTLSTRPSERDVDGARGVYAWDLTLAPGETQTIRMDAEFSWPEGQILNWQP